MDIFYLVLNTTSLLLWRSIPLNIFLGASLWSFYFIFSFMLGFQTIGRGHREQVYVDTSNGREAVAGFAPDISIPLDEVIDYYGYPEEVCFTSDSASE